MRSGGVYTFFLILVSVLGSLFLGLAPLESAQAKTRAEVNVFLPSSADNIQALTSFESSLGIKFTGAMWYLNWSTNFDPNQAKNFYNTGHIPYLTWEPQTNDGTGVSYDAVINGSYDGYITNFAQKVASLGFPIRISLAPEMNTDWTPWGIGFQGNNANNFKGFWQHVVQKFRDAGTTNVSWVWSPNVTPENAQQLYGGKFSNIYPGNNYVDYMGLDGYNWGTSQSWSEWQTFSQVFGNSYSELTTLSNKDIIIMEIASAEAGGNKANWITDMFNQIQNNYPKIKGFTWFNINKETDWRINSSDSAKAAFVSGYNLGAATSNSSSSSSSTTSKATTQTSSSSKSSPPPQTTNSSTDLENSKDPVNQVYAPTQPLQPKIAGTLVAAERNKASFNEPEFTVIVGALLIAFLSIGSLTLRRIESMKRVMQNSTKLPRHTAISIDGLNKRS